MKKTRLIERNNKEELGKLYLKKGVDFALEKSFGKSYEFLKEGLDFITCDCAWGGWLNNFTISNKDVFNDMDIKNCNYFEYYFTKAFILSYEEGKKELYLALDAIDKYLEIVVDDYGYYVKGKILLAIEEPSEAIKNFYLSKEIAYNYRIEYRIGRTKDQYLNEPGLNEVYKSFLWNPSSACCARILKKYLKDMCLNTNIVDDNPLLISFSDSSDEALFQIFYEKFLNQENFFKEESISEFSVNYETLPIISEFVSVIKDKFDKILKAEDDDDDEEYYQKDNSYYQRDDYDRDTFNALTDGQHGDYDDWNDNGGDFDSLRDGLGY